VLAWPWLGARLFDHDAGLFVALVLATCALVPVHVTRGVLAGTGRFPRYGAQLALDGVLRLVGAGLLAGLGVRSAAAYGGVLVASQLVAVALTVGGHTCRAWAIDLATDAEAEQAGDPMPWRMIAHALGWMLVGTTVAQVLVNGGTVVVKAFSDPGDAAAGHFLTAVVLTRIPLFLYAALQASLLPGLSRRLADNDVVGARRGLRAILSIVFWVGTMTTVILLAVGPQLDALLFGPSFRIARLPVVLLSVGSTVYLLAATLAQALLATRAVRETAWCWIAGAVAFGVSLPLPGTVAMRASTSLLIGAAVACACFAVAVRARFARLAVSEAATDLVLATW